MTELAHQNIHSIQLTHVPDAIISLKSNNNDDDNLNSNGKTPLQQRRRRRRNGKQQKHDNNKLSDDSTIDTASVTSSDNSSCSSANDNNNNNNNNNKNNNAAAQKKQKQTKKNNGKNKQNKHRKPELSQTERNRYIAMDCEMVGVGYNGYKSMVARVTLIGYDGATLLDEFVKPTQPVVDLRTEVSGITEHDLEHAAMTLDECRQHVLSILEDKILVGHALKNDFKALGIQHPWHQTRDTAKYLQFMQDRNGVMWPRKLKDLSRTRLQRDIQTPGRPHDPYEDAKAAMDLYRLVRTNWERAVCYKLAKTQAIVVKS